MFTATVFVWFFIQGVLVLHPIYEHSINLYNMNNSICTYIFLYKIILGYYRAIHSQFISLSIEDGDCKPVPSVINGQWLITASGYFTGQSIELLSVSFDILCVTIVHALIVLCDVSCDMCVICVMWCLMCDLWCVVCDVMCVCVCYTYVIYIYIHVFVNHSVYMLLRITIPHLQLSSRVSDNRLQVQTRSYKLFRHLIAIPRTHD